MAMTDESCPWIQGAKHCSAREENPLYTTAYTTAIVHYSKVRSSLKANLFVLMEDQRPVGSLARFRFWCLLVWQSSGKPENKSV